MSEYALHPTVAKFLKDHLGGRILWWHTPNAGRRSAKTAGQLKGRGVKRGVPDFAFILPPHGRAAYIELKTTARDSKESNFQIGFGEKAKLSGALYAVCETQAEVEGTLKGWGVL